MQHGVEEGVAQASHRAIEADGLANEAFQCLTPLSNLPAPTRRTHHGRQGRMPLAVVGDLMPVRYQGTAQVGMLAGA
jgi:hypothetical protein